MDVTPSSSALEGPKHSSQTGNLRDEADTFLRNVGYSPYLAVLHLTKPKASP